MDEMKLDAINKARLSKNIILQHIYQLAEQSAEVYVSSYLGLEDDNVSKMNIKQQYYELFLEEIKLCL